MFGFIITNRSAFDEEIVRLQNLPDATSWAEDAAHEMRRTAEAIAAAPIPHHLGEERLNFAKLGEGTQAVIDRLAPKDRIDRDRSLYIIGLDDQADPEEILRTYAEAKRRGDLKLPQNNSVTSNVLYVGSSCATAKRTNTLRSRLSQHLISAPRGTYALSMAKWASHLSGGLIVNTWQYPPAGEGLDGDKAARLIVLSVEEWLANKLKPMLGRRGLRH